MAEVSMPRLSDTMEEGTIAAWLKKPGERVERGEVIAQIETDKATMDLTSFEAGTLQEILAPEGATVAIGKPVARIGSGAQSASPAVKPDSSAAAAPAAVPAPAPPTPPPAAAAPMPAVAPPPPPPDAAAPEAASQGTEAANGQVRASPMARHLAAEHGLDLAHITGSGPGGRVIRADVEAALAATPPKSGAQPPPPTPVSADEDQRVKLSQMRRTIARRMAESASTIPHFYLTTTVDASDLVALRKQINDQGVEAGVRITLNDLIVRGVALTLRKMPEVNVSFADDSLIQHSHVNIGIAVATDRGLIVPVVRDVDRKHLADIARETRDLAERANAGKLQPPDYSGGTFTVSNLGMFGVEQFTAVINPPEAAILAVGASVREPAEYQGQIVLRDRLKLTLSVDHRALDGAVGARFLQALKALLEKPLLLMV